MNVLVNNQIKSLSITDPKTGLEWTKDLLENADAFNGYDDERDLPTMAPENYDWWLNYIEKEQYLQNRIRSIRVKLHNTDDFNQALIDAIDNDYEITQMQQISIVEQYS